MPHTPLLSSAHPLTALSGIQSGSRRADDRITRRTGAAALAAALAAASEQWLDRVEYRPAGRWTHLLHPDDAAAALDPSLHAELAAAQVWLLSWLPRQGTPLHDHGRSAGAFAVVRGTLTERVVAVGRPGRAVQQTAADLTAGRVRHFGAHYVHQVTNTAGEPAVSVHVYTPGLTEMNTYSVVDHRLVRTGTEQAGVDW
jgi:predicted metal-dependent enzyme (double-stranded beta helix superfamily)